MYVFEEYGESNALQMAGGCLLLTCIHILQKDERLQDVSKQLIA